MSGNSLNILLIGHRGSGKTTLGREVARAGGIRFFDLDEEIHRRTGILASDWVAENEPSFRAQELMTFGALRMSGACIIAAGGGFLLKEALDRGLANDTLIVWIDREGWDDVARTQRARLKPETPFEQERTWMIETREPVYERYSDWAVHIERGCGEQEAAERLLEYIAGLQRALTSNALQRTWAVPSNAGQIRSAVRMASLFPLAGIEIRSDFNTAEYIPGKPYCASLRTSTNAFFPHHREAAVFDLDVRFLDSANLADLAPRRLVLSSHPGSVGASHLDEFRRAVAWIKKLHPNWIGYIEFKYAPRIAGWTDLREAFRIADSMKMLDGTVYPTAFLPQGKRWEWVRAMLLHNNPMNYVSSTGVSEEGMPPPLRYFFPYCASGGFAKHYAVIGDPVEHSIGSHWHMERSIRRRQQDMGYYNIRVEEDGLRDALSLLREMGFTGISVTSPLKRAVAVSEEVENDAQLPAGNTLVRTPGKWKLFDTDERGMDAVLEKLEANGIHPGTAAVFGAGGVSAALVRALESRGWVVSVISARKGWTSFSETAVTLIINAAGAGNAAYDSPPVADVWVDLHYRNIAVPPPGVRVHISGMQFYRAQAIAQRTLWGLE